MEIGARKLDCGGGIPCFVKQHGEINDGRVLTMVDVDDAIPVVKSVAACLLLGALVLDLTGWGFGCHGSDLLLLFFSLLWLEWWFKSRARIGVTCLGGVVGFSVGCWEFVLG